VTFEMIRDIHFECLPHLPYSPDLAPCDYHIFGPLKETLGENTFQSDEEVHETGHERIHMQPNYFFIRNPGNSIRHTRGHALNTMGTVLKNYKVVLNLVALN
jgi:hypothetical protein